MVYAYFMSVLVAYSSIHLGDHNPLDVFLGAFIRFWWVCFNHKMDFLMLLLKKRLQGKNKAIE